MLPNRYILPDNNLQIILNQSRNNGALDYSITLLIDRNKHEEGINLIDAMVLTDVNISDLFEDDPLSVVP